MDKISVYFIVKNEESRLQESISQALKVADELIVVDSGSTDRTVEIAESLGARVVFRAWSGFASQKAFAASLCQNAWVLDLDADEILSDELVKEINRLKDSGFPVDAACFKMTWRYIPPFSGHPLRYSPDQTIPRLYNVGRANIAPIENSNDDRPKVISGKTYSLKGVVYHKSLISFEQIERKWSMLSSDQASAYCDSGRSVGLFRLLAEFPLKFIKYFILDGGYRNGWYGFVLSIIAAQRNLMRFAKAKEAILLKKLAVKIN